jgi:hypothetical protein
LTIHEKKGHADVWEAVDQERQKMETASGVTWLYSSCIISKVYMNELPSTEYFSSIFYFVISSGLPLLPFDFIHLSSKLIGFKAM